MLVHCRQINSELACKFYKLENSSNMLCKYIVIVAINAILTFSDQNFIYTAI